VRYGKFLTVGTVVARNEEEAMVWRGTNLAGVWSLAVCFIFVYLFLSNREVVSTFNLLYKDIYKNFVFSMLFTKIMV
jgi:hypothetical protein